MESWSVWNFFVYSILCYVILFSIIRILPPKNLCFNIQKIRNSLLNNNFENFPKHSNIHLRFVSIYYAIEWAFMYACAAHVCLWEHTNQVRLKGFEHFIRYLFDNNANARQYQDYHDIAQIISYPCVRVCLFDSNCACIHIHTSIFFWQSVQNTTFTCHISKIKLCSLLSCVANIINGM